MLQVIILRCSTSKSSSAPLQMILTSVKLVPWGAVGNYTWESNLLLFENSKSLEQKAFFEGIGETDKQVWNELEHSTRNYHPSTVSNQTKTLNLFPSVWDQHLPLASAFPRRRNKKCAINCIRRGAADRTWSVLNLGPGIRCHLNTASHRHSLPRAASRLWPKRKYSIDILVSRHANFSSRKIDFAKSGVMLELEGGKSGPRLHFVARRLAKREPRRVALGNGCEVCRLFPE